MTATRAFAAQNGQTPLAEMSIDRRAPGPKDVAIDILYCGVCHSDLHTARGEWNGVRFPSVPGHESVVQKLPSVRRSVVTPVRPTSALTPNQFRLHHELQGSRPA